MPPVFQNTKDGILAHWGETDITSTAMKILDFLAGSDQKEFSFDDFVTFLDQPLDANLLGAVTILTNSSFAVLQCHGIFLDGNERYDLTSESLANLWQNGTLKHPQTGEPVRDASSHTYIVFDIIETPEGT